MDYIQVAVNYCQVLEELDCLYKQGQQETLSEKQIYIFS